MKTMKFRLLATIITLAAVIATTTSLNAQRRSTSDNTNSRKVENTRSGNINNVEKKSATRETTREPRATSRISKSAPEVRRTTPSNRTEPRGGVSQRGNDNRPNGQGYTKSADLNRNKNNERAASRSNNNSRNQSIKVTPNVRNERRTTGTPNIDNRGRSNNTYERGRSATTSYSKRYNLDENDARYRPARGYKGSDRYWSSDFRGNSRNSHSAVKNYRYNKYHHWDHHWEGYRWNHYSWMNYYSFYSPHSYRYAKYYYHHNHYGHVLRKFVYRPQIFIHNHTRYYCYDGYFFRYLPRVGYVLVDIPFGMAFDYLPGDYERVNINGYLYFRVGNLFFEQTNYGFQIVHYPERYFAYNDGYYNGGFRFDDMGY
jgi:hypothetical protein